MRNKLADLNNHLFAQLEVIGDESIKGEELDEAIRRGQAMVGIASQIIAGGNLQIKTMELARECGIQVKADSLMLITATNEP